jgi:hypothetical protein
LLLFLLFANCWCFRFWQSFFLDRCLKHLQSLNFIASSQSLRFRLRWLSPAFSFKHLKAILFRLLSLLYQHLAEESKGLQMLLVLGWLEQATSSRRHQSLLLYNRFQVNQLTNNAPMFVFWTNQSVIGSWSFKLPRENVF